MTRRLSMPGNGLDLPEYFDISIREVKVETFVGLQERIYNKFNFVRYLQIRMWECSCNRHNHKSSFSNIWVMRFSQYRDILGDLLDSFG